MRVRRATARHLALAVMMTLCVAIAGTSANGQRIGSLMPPLPSIEEARPQPHQTRPLPEIVAQVQATPPYSDMDYIGVAGFETQSMIYVLRFLNGRQVIVVRVDGRSGRIISAPPRR